MVFVIVTKERAGHEKRCRKWPIFAANRCRGTAGRGIGGPAPARFRPNGQSATQLPGKRSEEHTSELQSLMRTSYAVFCLKKKINKRYPLQLLDIHSLAKK